MAITRRQFVTRLSTLAAAMGMSQMDLAKVTEAFAHTAPWNTNWSQKPRVVWVHGAECTGCSTSLLSFFEDVRGTAIEGAPYSTLAALDLAVGGDGDGGNVLGTYGKGQLGLADPLPAGHPYAHRTLSEVAEANVVDIDYDNTANNTFVLANIADVLIDFIDLQYHETVMGMGGDLAYQWLDDLRADALTGNAAPFVMVVEGAIQPSSGGGYWGATGAAPWCSIGMSEDDSLATPGLPVGEHSFDEVVTDLAVNDSCVAIIPIGQCATFGGYPACVSPTLGAGMTGAQGTFDFLVAHGETAAADKVINVPGCPTNPWWFILTVVAFLVDFVNPSRPLKVLLPSGAINPAAIDNTRRLKAVYGSLLHGPYCKRYQSYVNGVFAKKPGDPGCLQLIGCKGPQTMTTCGFHGWNSQQPRNSASLEFGVAGANGGYGGNCVVAGHPCMGCTEKGYPDAFLPFVSR